MRPTPGCSLNNIEHGIIRERLEEPRIHFALVCALVSCPRLRKEAFTADRPVAQLESAAAEFFNNPSKNLVAPRKAKRSKILDW